MTLFEYLKIPNEINILTEQFYAYDDKLVYLKTNTVYDNISQKLTRRDQSLSEQLKLPIILIDVPIPFGISVVNLQIKDKDNRSIYAENIIEKTGIFQPANVNGEFVIKNIRGLYLIWGLNGNPISNNILYPEAFNTIEPNGNKFDIRQRGNNEILELPK